MKNFEDGTEAVNTFDGLVVDDTCLLSVLSTPSVSSPVDCPGEALVFLRSLFDLHWISVSRPANSVLNILHHIQQLCYQCHNNK